MNTHQNGTEQTMYCVEDTNGKRFITSDTATIQAAISMDWKVWRDGKRVW